ncbi:MAG: ATP-binding protein [Planctomycetota bacterium]
MFRPNIRWQLTLWYGGVLALVLVFFSVTVYVVMRHQLLQPLDQGLNEELADVLFEIRRASTNSGLHEWLDRRFAKHEGFDYQITTRDGSRFFVSDRMATKDFHVAKTVSETPMFRSEAILSSGNWRVVSVIQKGPEGDLTVQVARSLDTFDHASADLLATLTSVGALTLLVTMGGGYFLARRALAPVFHMSQTADGISAERLHQRIPIENPNDELGALGATFNRVIERLERSFLEIQRFTADAAHELRTPLAVMRNEAEIALRSARSPDEYATVIENLLEEINSLTRLADRLLFLHRSDAGLQNAKREPVALDQVLRDVVSNMQLVAEHKGVELILQDEGVRIVGDDGFVRRVLYNVLDNAIKYTQPGGKVVVACRNKDGRALVCLEDTGVGIAPEHLPHVFDRFYRVDPSRTGESGAGLGLAITKALVKNLGGTIDLQSRLGEGTTVLLDFPTSVESRSSA